MKDALDGPSHRGHPTTSATVTITPKEFGIFKSFLKVIRSDFNDLSMVNGVFRAKSNDKTCIVETGFRFFNDISINVYDIKSFVKQIELLNKDCSTIFTVDDNGLTINDNLSSFGFAKKDPSFSDNKYIPDEEFEEIVIQNIDPTRSFVNNALPFESIKRIKRAARIFSQNKIIFKRSKKSVSEDVFYMNEKNFIKTKKKDRATEAEYKLSKSSGSTMKQNQYFNFSVLPIKLATDHLYFSSYIDNNGFITTIFNTKLSSLFVNFYTSSKLLEESKSE